MIDITSRADLLYVLKVGASSPYQLPLRSDITDESTDCLHCQHHRTVGHVLSQGLAAPSLPSHISMHPLPQMRQVSPDPVHTGYHGLEFLGRLPMHTD